MCSAIEAGTFTEIPNFEVDNAKAWGFHVQIDVHAMRLAGMSL